MSAAIDISRRGFLASACCLAAAPIFTPVTFAAMPGDNRFVAIVLRGAMDGLDLVQPYGDPDFRTRRPEMALTGDDGLIDLDGFFGLHPAAAPLMPLWQTGELAFVHAVSTPYRDGRSHFDGQDILEMGGAEHRASGSGWLNRALSLTTPPIRAMDVSPTTEIILSGPNPADVWSTRADIALKGDDVAFFSRLYEKDPAFSAAFAEATGIDSLTDSLFQREKRGNQTRDLTRMVASVLNQQYRIASFSINGWDTHVNQKSYFAPVAKELAETILGLKRELGEAAWQKTAIVAMTEFGRTVRQNGSGGTDHGTGGCCILAGGAIAGRRVLGKWPGLGEGALFEDRDLMPTGDVRAVAAAMLYRQFGISAAALQSTVFPGVEFDPRSDLLRA